MKSATSKYSDLKSPNKHEPKAKSEKSKKTSQAPSVKSDEIDREVKYKEISCPDTQVLYDIRADFLTKDWTVYELVTSLFPVIMESVNIKPAMRTCIVEDDMLGDEQEGESSSLFLNQFLSDSSDEELNVEENESSSDKNKDLSQIVDKPYRERLAMVLSALIENPSVSKQELAKVLTEPQMKPLDDKILKRVKLPRLDNHVDLKFNNHHYTGRMSRLTLEGKGVLKLYDSTLYDGDFCNNTLHGEGRLEWPDGSWYEGYFKDNYRHGYGMYRSRDNPEEVYIGDWFQGKRHGFGYQYYELSKDDFYEGDFRCNRREGQGLRRWANGQTYTGSWENNRIHGLGVMRFLNATYSGQWFKGQMHGTGTYIWTGEGEKVDLLLDETQFSPQKIMEKALNRSLDGVERSSKMCNNNSPRTLSLTRSYNVYSGQWRLGQRHGEGELSSASRIKFKGTWVRNKKHGQGILIRPNGTVICQVTCVNDIMYLKSGADGDISDEKLVSIVQ